MDDPNIYAFGENDFELLACPFCGGEAVLDCLTDEDEYFVHCRSCEVQQIANNHKSTAIIRWNTRGGQRVLTNTDIERIGRKAEASGAIKRGGTGRF